MSDTKNHKLAIKAIIEAHRTPGKMREIMLTILADKPSAIVNAWEEVKPVKVEAAEEEIRKVVEKIRNEVWGAALHSGIGRRVTCGGCYCVFMADDKTTECPECGRELKQPESP